MPTFQFFKFNSFLGQFSGADVNQLEAYLSRTNDITQASLSAGTPPPSPLKSIIVSRTTTATVLCSPSFHRLTNVCAMLPVWFGFRVGLVWFVGGLFAGGI